MPDILVQIKILEKYDSLAPKTEDKLRMLNLRVLKEELKPKLQKSKGFLW